MPGPVQRYGPQRTGPGEAWRLGIARVTGCAGGSRKQPDRKRAVWRRGRNINESEMNAAEQFGPGSDAVAKRRLAATVILRGDFLFRAVAPGWNVWST